MKSNEGALNKGAPTTAPAPAPSVGSSPKAPHLGPIKRERDSDDDIPDLSLNNLAPTPTPTPAPAPAIGSSPKAQCLGLGGVEQGAKK